MLLFDQPSNCNSPFKVNYALNPKEYDRWLNEIPALCGYCLFLLLDICPHCCINAKQVFFQKNEHKILRSAQIIAQCYQQNGHLFAMGNGGSSCDAAHITTEFMHPVTTGRKALGFTNLTADIATMTAVANDVGNEHIFLRQLLCLARKNDVLIGFSTSGNSKSLIKAFAQAKEMVG
jgi:phosphoheptose isomerase